MTLPLMLPNLRASTTVTTWSEIDERDPEQWDKIKLAERGKRDNEKPVENSEVVYDTAFKSETCRPKGTPTNPYEYTCPCKRSSGEQP